MIIQLNEITVFVFKGPGTWAFGIYCKIVDVAQTTDFLS